MIIPVGTKVTASVSKEGAERDAIEQAATGAFNESADTLGLVPRPMCGWRDAARLADFGSRGRFAMILLILCGGVGGVFIGGIAQKPSLGTAVGIGLGIVAASAVYLYRRHWLRTIVDRVVFVPDSEIDSER